MNCRDVEPLLSALIDGELQDPSGVAEHVASCPQCGREIEALRHLSAVLRVPASEAAADPSFVVRFRARRDEMLASPWARQPWRWLAVRLAPLAAAAMVVAALVVWSSVVEENDALRELEAGELGNGLAAVTEETVGVEPVMRIALGDFPVEGRP